MSEPVPVYGCSGCQTTGGAMGCPEHGVTRYSGDRLDRDDGI